MAKAIEKTLYILSVLDVVRDLHSAVTGAYDFPREHLDALAEWLHWRVECVWLPSGREHIEFDYMVRSLARLAIAKYQRHKLLRDSEIGLDFEAASSLECGKIR